METLFTSFNVCAVSGIKKKEKEKRKHTLVFEEIIRKIIQKKRFTTSDGDISDCLFAPLLYGYETSSLPTLASFIQEELCYKEVVL